MRTPVRPSVSGDLQVPPSLAGNSSQTNNLWPSRVMHGASSFLLSRCHHSVHFFGAKDTFVEIERGGSISSSAAPLFPASPVPASVARPVLEDA